MPAPGSVWADDTWDVDAWEADTWADAVDQSVADEYLVIGDLRLTPALTGAASMIPALTGDVTLQPAGIA